VVHPSIEQAFACCPRGKNGDLYKLRFPSKSAILPFQHFSVIKKVFNKIEFKGTVVQDRKGYFFDFLSKSKGPRVFEVSAIYPV
jgi:hypothetical protein